MVLLKKCFDIFYYIQEDKKNISLSSIWPQLIFYDVEFNESEKWTN